MIAVKNPWEDMIEFQKLMLSLSNIYSILKCNQLTPKVSALKSSCVFLPHQGGSYKFLLKAILTHSLNFGAAV